MDLLDALDFVFLVLLAALVAGVPFAGFVAGFIY
jgi:hypothetical protein